MGADHPLFPSFPTASISDVGSDDSSTTMKRLHSTRNLMALSGTSDRDLLSRGTTAASAASAAAASFSSSTEDVKCAACANPIDFNAPGTVSLGFDVILCGTACEKFWRAARRRI